MSKQYPDIVSLVEDVFARSPTLTSFIVDSEVVAVDKNTNAMRSFQELANRARKDVRLQDIKVAVCVFAFDLMFLNGNVCPSRSCATGLLCIDVSQVLIQEPFRRRRELLRQHLPPHTPEDEFSARLDHIPSSESADGREALEAFWQESLELKTEGLMIKVRFFIRTWRMLRSPALKLLDHAEVNEETSTKAGAVKSRRKPLPASYEPGELSTGIYE